MKSKKTAAEFPTREASSCLFMILYPFCFSTTYITLSSSVLLSVFSVFHSITHLRLIPTSSHSIINITLQIFIFQNIHRIILFHLFHRIQHRNKYHCEDTDY